MVNVWRAPTHVARTRYLHLSIRSGTINACARISVDTAEHIVELPHVLMSKPLKPRRESARTVGFIVGITHSQGVIGITPVSNEFKITPESISLIILAGELNMMTERPHAILAVATAGVIDMLRANITIYYIICLPASIAVVCGHAREANFPCQLSRISRSYYV